MTPGAAVTVETGSRLHFGLLTGVGTHCGRHAGLGLMLDRPRVLLSAARAETDSITAPTPHTAQRAEQFMAEYRRHSPSGNCPRCCLTIRAAIPAHAGLGSGTQLALAVALAMASLASEPEASTEPFRLAERVGRARRSAIGTAGVRWGGLLVDWGEDRRVDRRVVPYPVPDDWRIVLATPGNEVGISGDVEVRAFDELVRTSVPETDRLWNLATDRVVPSLVQADFTGFSEAVYEYGRGVGATFAAVQGGVFATPMTERIVAYLRRHGISGVGQTSWGPTVFAFTADAATAEQVAADLQAMDESLQVQVTPVRSGGASVMPHFL